MKTASYACAFARAKVGQAYWYGTFGQKCSYELMAEKKKAYPSYYDQSKYSVKFTDQIVAGMKCCDCSGLIKWILWSESIENDTPHYNAIPGTDLSANDMISKGCTDVGSISNLPEIPGLILWKNNHVGIYLGNGKAVEARGHDWGIVISDVASRGWQKYGKLKWFDYSVQPAPTPTQKCSVSLPVLRKGDKNDSVKKLQILLNGLGFTDINGTKLVVDGSFGGKTDFAVRNFQSKSAINSDGVVGAQTWTKLLT